MKQATSKKQQQESTLVIHVVQRLREGLFLLQIAVSLFLLIALVTYNVNDPGWSGSGTSTTIINAGGKAGAWLADFFLYMFGYLAYLLPLMVAYLGYLYYLGSRSNEARDYQLLSLKYVGFAVVIISGTGFASIHLSNINAHLPYTAGGIIGNAVGAHLVDEFSVTGATLFLVALFLGGITWFSGFSWLKFTRFISQHGLQAGIYLKNKLLDFISKVKEKKPSLPSLPKPATMQKIIPKLKPKAEAEITPIDAPIIVTPTIPKPAQKKTKEAVHKVYDAAKQEGLPPIAILDAKQVDASVRVSSQVLEERSREVENKLKDFGIDAQVVAVHPGPVITRYELQLAPGIKVSKLTGLAKDLARSLSMISVRIVEVIPGKSVVGLELPNDTRALVTLREVLESNAYNQARSSLSMALGKDISGHPVIVDLAKMPHLLVAGTTGSGKSVGVNAMLMSLLFKSTAEDVRLILVDPKMLELSVYDGIPHLLAPVVTDMKEAANALRWCVGEMERRYKLMASLGVRNISGYNHKVKEAIKNGKPIPDPLAPDIPEIEAEPLQPLPHIVVMIDEFADMMMVVGKKVEQLIARIAQKARAAGIHLILATQRPSVDVITGLIKANIPTRIAYQVSSKIDSRTILDQQGAEQLLGHGDMLYLAPGAGVPMRVHGAFVADDEVHKVVSELKKIGKPAYLPNIFEEASADAESGMLIAGIDEPEGEQDALYDQAVEFVIQSRRASISSVQRRLKVGYNRAARLIEDMERAGLVSGMESNGSREVLVPPQQQ